MKNLLIIAKLSDAKLISKIEPLCSSSEVQDIYLVRKTKLPLQGVISIAPSHCQNGFLVEAFRIWNSFLLCWRKKVDVIVAIYTFPHGLYAVLLGKMFNIPVVQLLIGSELYGCWRTRFSLHILKRCQAIITRGQTTNAYLVDQGIPQAKLYSIPNVFSYEGVDRFNADVIAAPLAYDLIYIGNFVQVKRLDILLHAIAQVKQIFPGQSQIKVALVGKGPLEKMLNRLIQQLDLRDNVELVPYQSNVYPYLHRSRIFIMTSEFEGLPMSMIEAMSLGKPCIMPRVSNIPEYAHHEENSLLVTPLDIGGFAQAIGRLLTDRELYNRLSLNAAQSRALLEPQFKSDAIRAQWEDLLKKL